MNGDFALDDLHYLMRDSSFWKNQNLLDLPWKSERPPFFNRFFGTEFHPKAIPAFCLMVGRKHVNIVFFTLLGRRDGS